MSEEKDPLPSHFEKINRHSQRDIFIFYRVTLVTNKFESPKQEGFMKGETYDVIAAFKVDGKVYKVKSIKPRHIQKIVRSLQLGP